MPAMGAEDGPVERGTEGMKLCVMMPALNEEATIVDVIQRIPKEIPGISETVVVVVDDGSTDGTSRQAREAGALVVRHPQNRGVGAAFQSGVRKALDLEADLLVNIDSDGQFDPHDIPKLIGPLLSGQAGFVTASRFLEKEYYPEMSRVRFYGNKLMSFLISKLAGHKFCDVSCGFRAYTRDTLLELNLFGGFTYTQETFLDLTFKGIPIVEVPVRVRGTREFGKSRVASNLLSYAYRTGKIIFRSYRDYKPMHIFGALAALVWLAAVGILGFLGVHYIRTSGFTPYKTLGFVGGFLLAMGFLIFVTGLVADMLTRMRINQERILYMLRKRGF